MKITIGKRLYVMAAMRRIRTAKRFGELMTAAGYPLSHSQATRIFNDQYKRMSLDFINAACNVLQCSPGDLYEITVTCGHGEGVPESLNLPPHARVISQ